MPQEGSCASEALEEEEGDGDADDDDEAWQRRHRRLAATYKNIRIFFDTSKLERYVLQVDCVCAAW